MWGRFVCLAQPATVVYAGAEEQDPRTPATPMKAVGLRCLEATDRRLNRDDGAPPSDAAHSNDP
jgi:hypothetical protein